MPAQEPKGALTVPDEAGKKRGHLIAEIAMSPIVANIKTARSFGKTPFGELDLGECIAVMREKADRVKAGDLCDVETTLIAQAVALDAIFNALVARAAMNMGEHLNVAEIYLRLGLKAQAQCRSTLQALAEMKNPPMIYARQANIAQGGPQQVNNVAVAASPARKNEIGPNKLLEAMDGERLDTGATGETIGANPAMASVGELDRTEIAPG